MLLLEDHVPCGDGNPRAGHLNVLSASLFLPKHSSPPSFPKLPLLFLILPLGPRLDIASPGCVPLEWEGLASILLCLASLGHGTNHATLRAWAGSSMYDEGPSGAEGVDATVIGGGQMGGRGVE